jgi:integrase
MGKVLAFARVSHRQARSFAPVQPPHVNPAQLWIDGHKPGQSQTSAAAYLNMAARLMDYGDGSTNDYAACPWWTLTYEDVHALRNKLNAKVAAGEYVAGTANHILDAVKGVMAVVWRIGLDKEVKYLSADSLRVIEDIKRIPGKKLRKARRTLTDAEYSTIIKHLTGDTSPRGLRDLALFGVAGMAGPRASELAALVLADYDATLMRLRIPQIKVETDEEDIWHPLEPPVTDYLDKWIRIRGMKAGALFTRLERGGVGLMQTLRADAITDIMARRGEEAGVEGVTCHALRRFFVTRMLRQTSDLSLVQKLVRHSASSTTAGYYDQRGEPEKREAIKRLASPGNDDAPGG